MTRMTRRSMLALLAGLAVAPLARLRAQPAGRRRQFICVLRVAPKFHEARDWTDEARAATSRHFERLARAAESGQVILAGRSNEPLADTFGLVIFEADNEEAARQFMEADPAVVSGVMTATLHPYTMALQRKQGPRALATAW